VSKPKLLDLFCCEGGASTGYQRAGFDVYGVDLFEDYTQKRYPFPSLKGDVIVVLEYMLRGWHLWFSESSERFGLDDFDVIVASPPCQHASAGTRAQDRSKYPRLIEPTRKLLIETGLPYVIENVRGADLIDPIELCGCMFDLTTTDIDGLPLRLERPRGFESNIALSPPRPCQHDASVWVAGAYGGGRKAKRHPGETLAEVAPRDRHAAKYERHGGYVPRSKAVQQELLGIDWMTVRGMHQSIPPAYTEWLGKQLIVRVQ